MMYGSPIIMLDTLHLHGAVCPLYLNNTGRKKKAIEKLKKEMNILWNAPT